MVFFLKGESMELKVTTSQNTYSVIIERGILNHVAEYIDTKRRVYIVSDDGVPEAYQDILLSQFIDASIYIFPFGEASKNLSTYEAILKDMLEKQISRKDLLIALGGGVVGDMAGFAAATYMRGIEYINIPTTTLSQIDSSIGGKTAVDLNGRKNSVGAFWQPSLVLIDPETLKTLPKRQISAGLAEAVKMGMICDRELFELFEKDDYYDHIDEIIFRSLKAKRDVVAEDERETGLRKILNFGHTYGHAYESLHGFTYLHGECVAMGMMTILDDEVLKERLKAVLMRLELPLSCEYDRDALLNLMRNDKKAEHEMITVCQVHALGSADLEAWTMKELGRRV